jgi:hypothetical protein
MGVLHRDIKPANLLVDWRGSLWVTDFGLAHCRSQSGLTLTGDLVGTLRYMSPEQAMAQRGVIDHRSDVYSLGVTLYELLTLQPAFDGQDRQELLRQIAFEEPRPPRRIHRTIPTELETIVLKAMAKEPAERYGTAQELADDLQRFLKDEPIRARRPTVQQRATKWARRHKGVAWMGVLLLAVLALGSAASTALIYRQLTRANNAEAELAAKLQVVGLEEANGFGHDEVRRRPLELAGPLTVADEVVWIEVAWGGVILRVQPVVEARRTRRGLAAVGLAVEVPRGGE